MYACGTWAPYGADPADGVRDGCAGSPDREAVGATRSERIGLLPVGLARGGDKGAGAGAGGRCFCGAAEVALQLGPDLLSQVRTKCESPCLFFASGTGTGLDVCCVSSPTTGLSPVMSSGNDAGGFWAGNRSLVFVRSTVEASSAADNEARS